MFAITGVQKTASFVSRVRARARAMEFSVVKNFTILHVEPSLRLIVNANRLLMCKTFKLLMQIDR